MIQKKSDDAVSPVIGVMLMLVITVVIAAVITMFATGMITDTEPAPVAALDVKIYDYYQALDIVGGPDIHITHLSGDPVDTRDIELRFSWTDTCGESHYSTYSADGMEENYKDGKDGIESAGGLRKQALYVKTPVTADMRNDYGSARLDYYFGDVILTPGMKLTATGDFLDANSNTESKFMDIIFNNYDEITEIGPDPEPYYSTHGPTYNPDCQDCKKWGTYCYIADAIDYGYNLNEGDCAYCYDSYAGFALPRQHSATECTKDCPCVEGSSNMVGIMAHLQPGTAVDVMIIHTPSNKAIYDKTVVVQ